MSPEQIRKLLIDVKDGTLNIEQALEQIRSLPFEDIEFANVDHHRTLRSGFPEVIFCQGKKKEYIVSIAKKIISSNSILLATRASEEVYLAVKEELPQVEYNSLGRVIFFRKEKKNLGIGKIVVITAGTSDIPVAEEAVVTAEVMGNEVEKIYDVGVAGIHRLFAKIDTIQSANVLIVVAGMEGALASVVGGVVSRPVIAVPTSVGYGASFGGLSALLTMLNSCSAGVTVVNIDNGFGAGYSASLINRKL